MNIHLQSISRPCVQNDRRIYWFCQSSMFLDLGFKIRIFLWNINESANITSSMIQSDNPIPSISQFQWISDSLSDCGIIINDFNAIHTQMYNLYVIRISFRFIYIHNQPTMIGEIMNIFNIHRFHTRLLMLRNRCIESLNTKDINDSRPYTIIKCQPYWFLIDTTGQPFLKLRVIVQLTTDVGFPWFQLDLQ